MRRLIYLLPLFFSVSLFADPVAIGPINFGGGVNYNVSETDITDSQSPDQCNCISESAGTIQKRYGTERYYSQAVSSNSITSLFNAYASTNGVVSRSLIFTSKDTVYHSTGGNIPTTSILESGLANSEWNWLSMSSINDSGSFDYVTIGAGGYDNDMKRFNVLTSSLTDLLSNDPSTGSVIIRPKYITMAQNYLIAANVKEMQNKSDLIANTTYYPSRAYYSLLLRPSSMTALRFIDYRTNDGEELTGIGSLFGKVHLFKPSTIGEVSFSVLNLPSVGGDQTITEIVNGFGLVAPKSLVTNGQFYIFCSKDGVRIWDGGRQGRLSASDSSRLISDDIQPLVRRLISAGTWNKSVGHYYKKRDWYILSYQDPEKYPKDALNSTIIFDFKIGQWYPFCNQQMSSFASIDSANEEQILFYGDSKDGYIYKMDVNTRFDDARKELIVDPMEDSSGWVGSSVSATKLEGSNALKIFTSNSITQATMTKISIFPVGEWKDGSKVSFSDKLSFKVLPNNLGNMTSLRIDLLVDPVESFNQNFTSVTLSSANFNNGNLNWNEFEISLSSFPLQNSWTDLNTELVPFSNTFTYYGIRFVLNSINVSTVTIDDLRVVQKSDNPINFYRKTKLFDFGSKALKGIGQIILTNERSPESSIKMDVFNDFGRRLLVKEFNSSYPRELIVFHGSSMTVLDSSDFSLIKSTSWLNYNIYNAVSDDKYMFSYDRTNRRLLKLDRSNFGLIISSYGTLGNGTTNFNLVHQISMNKDSLFMVDMVNQRIKEHLKRDFSFVKANGTLGQAATSYHQPTGIANDANNVYIANEGNYTLMKLNISTFGLVESEKIDYNSIGETTLAVDNEFVYLTYNKYSDIDLYDQQIILEKRNKSDLSLVNRINVVEKFGTGISTRQVVGDMAMSGKYLYIPFRNGNKSDPNVKYYIQKRLKDNLSLVKEFETDEKIYSVNAYPYNYESSIKTEGAILNTEGRYFQIRFYNSELDSFIKMYNQTFLAEPRPLTY